ncbi:MAG: alpha-amylase family glycosyl hydrolase [Candidatus Saccharimonas sp.]
MTTKPWREVNAIYQIYPRSFQDSNGDGVGDIRGIIDRLDYIRGYKASLGIDAIWLSPIYTSPMADMGYDVSNYTNVDPLFGSLDDFKQLIADAHTRNINVMLDFVPNHTSEQHPWFIESRSSRTNDKRDYYVWRDAKPDGSMPNNWLSIFGGPAWAWDEGRQQFYLHTFLKEQPDLNWDNPMVRDEMKRIIRFWMDLGVDGMRADAVRWMSKDPEFRDDPIDPTWRNDSHDKFGSLIHKYSRFWLNLFPYLRELTDIIAEYDNRIMIFEDYPDPNLSTREQYQGFYRINPDVSMPFNFEGIHLDFNAESFRHFVTDFQGMLDPKQHLPVYCFGNHDQPRMVSRYEGEDQARLVAMMQLTLPGLPVVYYGDELGMPNTRIEPEDIRDISAFSSGDISLSRDPSRTPMQWHKGPFAGFSDTKPWLPVGDSIRFHNVETATHEPDSMLSLYKRLLKLRANYEIFRKGSFEAFGEAESDVFVYARRFEEEHIFIALNFENKSRVVKLPHRGRVLCSTHPVDYPDMDEDTVNLRPFEGVVIECSEHPLQVR